MKTAQHVTLQLIERKNNQKYSKHHFLGKIYSYKTILISHQAVMVQFTNLHCIIRNSVTVAMHDKAYT